MILFENLEIIMKKKLYMILYDYLDKKSLKLDTRFMIF